MAAKSRGTNSLAILNRWGPALMVVLAILGGYWALHNLVVDGIKESVATAQRRIDGREAEDRDIRGTILTTSDALRTELGKLGDRLVASNQDIGAQINKMRGASTIVPNGRYPEAYNTRGNEAASQPRLSYPDSVTEALHPFQRSDLCAFAISIFCKTSISRVRLDKPG